MTTSTNALDLIASLLKAAEGRHASALKAVADAIALPKGTRGKRDAVKLAEKERDASFEALRETRQAITEANRSSVNAWLAGIVAGVSDPVIRQILDSRSTSRRSLVALDLTAYDFGRVFAEVSFDSSGIPTYVEVRKLADREERIEQAKRWLDNATTKEGKEQAEGILANPDAFPYYSGKSSLGSITIGQAWQYNDDEGKACTYTLNASSWQAESNEDAADAWRLVGAACVVRSKLNASRFPSALEIRTRLETIG
jgi:hypothetical protein